VRDYRTGRKIARIGLLLGAALAGAAAGSVAAAVAIRRRRSCAA
jgi:hypothetical protein